MRACSFNSLFGSKSSRTSWCPISLRYFPTQVASNPLQHVTCSMQDLRFTVWGKHVPDSILEKCADLFSHNYGKWSSKGLKPGHHITLSPTRLKGEYLFDSNSCTVITATTVEDTLVGHAFVCYFPFLGGTVAWVTQLVVKEEFRNLGIATELVAKTWTKDLTACGLVSSNPFAVLALERAMQRKCLPSGMAQCAEEVIKSSKIPYVQNCKVSISDSQSIIHSNFYVDHTRVNKVVDSRNFGRRR